MTGWSGFFIPLILLILSRSLCALAANVLQEETEGTERLVLEISLLSLLSPVDFSQSGVLAAAVQNASRVSFHLPSSPQSGSVISVVFCEICPGGGWRRLEAV
jgi:hypothetical protein